MDGSSGQTKFLLKINQTPSPPTAGMFLCNFFPNLSKKYDQKGVVMFKFTCFQEATATGNSRLVHLVLEERDKLRY